MTCDKAKEHFSGLFERSLPRGLAQAAERHLGECPACQIEFDVFKAVYGAAGDLGSAESPPDLADRIARRLDKADWERKQANGGSVWRRTPVFASAAAAVAVVAIGMWAWGPGGSDLGVGGSTLGAGGHADRGLRVVVAEGRPHIRLTPSSDTVIAVSAGGADFGTLPPSDATHIRTDRVARLQEYNVPLEGSGSTLWVLEGDAAVPLAIFLPGATASDVVEGSVFHALQTISNYFDIVIAARISADLTVHKLRLDSYRGPAEHAVDSVLHDLGYKVRESGGVLLVTPDGLPR